MAGQVSLQRGMGALERRSWGEADQHLSEARKADELAAGVLEQLAIVRLLVGRQEASEESWIEAHESFLRHGDPRGAARCAFWLGLLLVLRGEMARGGGWLGRAHEVLADHDARRRASLIHPAPNRRCSEIGTTPIVPTLSLFRPRVGSAVLAA